MKKSVISFLLVLVVVVTVTVPLVSVNHQIVWTEEERAFLEKKPVIRLGVDPGFVPYEFIDDSGEYGGIAADYLSLISSRTGLTFEVVKNLTWPEAYDLALMGEIDALPAVGKTTEREEHFLFSEPYYFFKRVIVTRNSDTDIKGMEDLEGSTVAVQRNSSHHSYLLSHPKINLSLYDSVVAALTAVATGAEKAFLGNLSTTDYLIRSHALTNLRYVSFEAEKEQALHFAVRKDWPELVSIFDTAMDTITEREKLAIHNKWITLDTHIDYGPIIRIVIMVSSGAAVVMGVSFFWILRLQREIRQRKRIQQELEKAKHEADEANAFKSSFLARMSHEIRTPLNAIMGITYLLQKTNLNLTQRMYADKITQASANMLNIIDDILDYSKIEAGKVELHIDSFSMDQVVQDVVDIVLWKMEEKEVAFKLTKDPRVPNWFWGDSKRIEQVLLNILNNAAKFTAKGEVSLDLRLVAQEGEIYHLAFTIKDTGIGMDEEQVQKLFSPFMQGDSSIKRRFGGSGLGLSIAKNLLDLMGGTIKVSSTSGVGSTFVLELPLCIDAEKEDAAKEAMAAHSFQNIKALVVEKEKESINLIKSYLDAFGLPCELATSRDEAIGILENSNGDSSQPFDLLIVDYETPPEGGFKFVTSVRNNTKIEAKPQFIMLLPSEELFEKLGDYGLEVGIRKPLVPSVLLNGVLNALREQRIRAAQTSRVEHDQPLRLDRSRKVLVVEDNKTNQFIAESLLKQEGIDTLLASDGKEAVEIYSQNKDVIALILMDLHMPIMDGYEAAEAIRKISSDVPIVAMTADVILGVKEKCEGSGIHHYISKPFKPDQFLAKVRSLLNSDGDVSEQVAILHRASGLKNMGGNADLYQKVLREYFHENRETGDKLTLAVQEKRYEEASHLVHKIKGSSGSIGAKSLYELAAKLQKVLNERNEFEIVTLTNQFTQELSKLLGEISKEEV